MTTLNKTSGAISDCLGVRGIPLRKALSNKGKPVLKVPKYKEVPTNKYVETNGISIYPIGIKKDKRQEWKEQGYEQEML